MGRKLSASAMQLGCSERTLRRCVNDGLLRGRRVARRQLELSDAEESYLRSHWGLLSALRAVLRTESAVRLAVLFGSTAVGDDDDGSDIDLLIVHRSPTPRALAGLKLRLRRGLERRVDVVGLERAGTMPTLLADVMREGRVLIDRDGLWAGLREHRAEVFEAAASEHRATAIRARETVTDARERLAAAV